MRRGLGLRAIRGNGASLGKARESVQSGLMTEEDFRRFTFEHAREFFGLNPRFFAGTRIEPYLMNTEAA